MGSSVYGKITYEWLEKYIDWAHLSISKISDMDKAFVSRTKIKFRYG